MAKTNPTPADACISRPAKLMNLRESVWKNDHEDRTAGKGFNSLSHCNLVHKSIPTLQATKIPDAKPAVDKEWEKLEKMRHGKLRKVNSKRRSFKRHRKRDGPFNFAALVDVCHL